MIYTPVKTGMKQSKGDNMKIIGITGGVGSGKSQIMDYLEHHYSAYCIKADKIAFELEQPPHLCYKSITATFGRDVLNECGLIDRRKLAEIVFSDSAQLKKLNEIVHPEVKKYIIDLINKLKTAGTYSYVFIEAALFFEDAYEKLCDEVWYVFVTEERRIRRLTQSRGYSLEKIHGIMKNQLSEHQFREKCNVILDNNGTFEQTIGQIREELECQKL